MSFCRIVPALFAAGLLAACGGAQPADVVADEPPSVSVTLERGQQGLVEVGGGYAVRFEPTDHGWFVTVLWLPEPGPELSCITPPRMGPNPRDLAGWHLRNRSNTGPNDAGPDNLNAPGTARTVLFAAPTWLTDPGTQCALGPVAVPPESLGTIDLRVVEYELTPPEEGGQAAYETATVRIMADLPQ